MAEVMSSRRVQRHIFRTSCFRCLVCAYISTLNCPIKATRCCIDVGRIMREIAKGRAVETDFARAGVTV